MAICRRETRWQVFAHLAAATTTSFARRVGRCRFKLTCRQWLNCVRGPRFCLLFLRTHHHRSAMGYSTSREYLPTCSLRVHISIPEALRRTARKPTPCCGVGSALQRRSVPKVFTANVCFQIQFSVFWAAGLSCPVPVVLRSA